MPEQRNCPKLPISPSGCAMDALLRLLMGQWTCYILWMLCQNGPMRFGALKRSIPGVSSKVLTERLRLLEDSRILFREHIPSIPPQVTYGLTERGKELMTALDELSAIAKRWYQEDQKNSQPTEHSNEG